MVLSGGRITFPETPGMFMAHGKLMCFVIVPRCFFFFLISGLSCSELLSGCLKLVNYFTNLR